jgi:crotonobetainyl-CoA:carnitine CoA-transferase CaiB-like acyl-CoA transferase
MAASAALLARGADGQAIEVSLLAGAFSLQTGGIMRHKKMTSLCHGPQDPLGPIPCYRLFEASDGRNPRIIYMSVNAFGNHGPDFDQPGFDPLLQARSGVMAAQGGPHGHPVYLTCAICDYGAAMLSAFGCVLALNARRQTGRGQFCETSLLQASDCLPGRRVHFLQRPPRYGVWRRRVSWPLGPQPLLSMRRRRLALSRRGRRPRLGFNAPPLRIGSPLDRCRA